VALARGQKQVRRWGNGRRWSVIEHVEEKGRGEVEERVKPKSQRASDSRWGDEKEVMVRERD
jgi:hypothetical protein